MSEASLSDSTSVENDGMSLGACRMKATKDSSGNSICASAARPLHLAREHHGDRGENEHDAKHREGVAETHHQCLMLYGLTERDDRLLMRGSVPISASIWRGPAA